MAIAPLAIAGMALAAAGTGVNMMQKKAAEKRAKGVLQASQKRVDRNSAQANQQWQEAAKGVTREQQEADLAAGAAERQGKYDTATADAADVALQPGADAPQVVKSESAKQLGTQLGKARELMAARAQLGGWTDTLLNDKFALNRSGENISQLGNFSLGDARAAQFDAQDTLAHKGPPIGDILMGLGSMMSMGAGAAGAAGGAASAAATAGNAASTALPLTGTVYSAATAPAADPGWFARSADWLTKPIKW